MPDSVALHRIDSGQGPAVVLMHGLFGTAANLGVVQKHLQARYRVVSLDLRNHGSSPHRSGMRYPLMAEDVVRTLDELGINDGVLIGHSMGGKVAMRVALDHPERVRGVSVLDIAPIRYKPAFRPFAEAMLSLDLTPDLSRRSADAWLAPAIPDPKVRGFLLQNLRFGPPPHWRIGLQEIADALSDIEDWPTPPAARYQGPIQFVSGAESDYIQPHHASAIQALFPQASMAVVEKAGHWLHADNPAGLLAVLDRFHLAHGV